MLCPSILKEPYQYASFINCIPGQEFHLYDLERIQASLCHSTLGRKRFSTTSDHWMHPYVKQHAGNCIELPVWNYPVLFDYRFTHFFDRFKRKYEKICNSQCIGFSAQSLTCIIYCSLWLHLWCKLSQLPACMVAQVLDLQCGFVCFVCGHTAHTSLTVLANFCCHPTFDCNQVNVHIESRCRVGNCPDFYTHQTRWSK